MRREYKGFYIERAEWRGNFFGYSLYHVVTGTLAGTLPTIRDAQDEINSIHTNAEVYASYAGCEPKHLIRKRNRFVYAKFSKGESK